MSKKKTKSSKLIITLNRPSKMLIGMWIASLASIALLYTASAAVVSDLRSLRSCSANNAGLSISNCGKQGLNLGDAVLFGLFIVAACLVASVLTATWRMTVKDKS